MGTDVMLQLGIILFTLGIFYTLFHLPKQALTKLRSNGRAQTQAHRHFIQGAQFLSRARSTRNTKATSINLAKSAVTEADKALSLKPRDPAAHILKALALDLMGHTTSALKSLDAALSPPAVKGLTNTEKADALVKRAELQLAVNRRRRVDSAVADLVEAAKLVPDNSSKAYCLLGQCYETKGLKEEAMKAFEEALKVEPRLVAAREGLDRLR